MLRKFVHLTKALCKCMYVDDYLQECIYACVCEICLKYLLSVWYRAITAKQISLFACNCFNYAWHASLRYFAYTHLHKNVHIQMLDLVIYYYYSRLYATYMCLYSSYVAKHTMPCEGGRPNQNAKESSGEVMHSLPLIEVITNNNVYVSMFKCNKQ